MRPLIIPELADELLFDSPLFTLLGGGPREWPNYELFIKPDNLVSYFPAGSKESLRIVRQIEAWNSAMEKDFQKAPREEEVLRFLAQFAGLNPSPLVIQ